MVSTISGRISDGRTDLSCMDRSGFFLARLPEDTEKSALGSALFLVIPVPL
jgi:hypothetical protein